MNLAHELGHTIIRPTVDESFDEKVAFRFAASLLMPADVLRLRLGRTRARVDLRELLLLKEEYGISIQALIRRCLDAGIISQWTYRQLNIELRSTGWHKDEPGDCSHPEGPTQIRSYLLRCVVEGLLSEERIHSMFPEVAKDLERLASETRWEWRGLRDQSRQRRHDAVRRAAELAKRDYRKGGSLHGLEVADDDT